MAATSSTGLIWNASISKNVQNILIYMCANFGAFRTIWTIGLLCRWTKIGINKIGLCHCGKPVWVCGSFITADVQSSAPVSYSYGSVLFIGLPFILPELAKSVHCYDKPYPLSAIQVIAQMQHLKQPMVTDILTTANKLHITRMT